MSTRAMHAALSVTALALALALGLPSTAVAADTTPPVTQPPRVVALLDGTVGKRVPFTVSWPAATETGSGVARYDLRQSVDGGSWQSVPLATATSRSVVLDLLPPHDYQFSVRAVDRAGNVGAWQSTPRHRVRRVSEATAALRTSAGWSLRSSSGYLGGSGLRSGTPSATATFSFTGRQVAWFAPKGTSRGSADVFIDGELVRQVSLYRSTSAYRRIAFRHAFAAIGSHTLTIRVIGTAGHPYVDVDGFVVLDAPPPDPTLVGAGDISLCSETGDSKTAALLDRIAGRVFVSGDLAYPDGTAAQFRDCYGPTWGRWRLRTSPVPGNHEYRTAGAAPYFAYFGARAGTAGKGWYAYNLGTWRVYSLNSNCAHVGCSRGSEQEAWLRADLAANPRRCVAAVWHHPRFSSGAHGGSEVVAPLWKALEDAGAEVVLAGHDHDYERFHPQTVEGVRDPDGLLQFVVGTGGAALRPFATVHPNSAARNATSHGVLRLTLRRDGYDWRFVPVDGATFSDSGSASCH